MSGEAPRFVKNPAFSAFSLFHTPPAAKKHIDGCPFQQPACPKYFGAGVVPEGVSEAQKGPRALRRQKLSKLWSVGTRKRAPRGGGFFPEISPFFRERLRGSFFLFLCRSFLAVFLGLVLVTEQAASSWPLLTARCSGHASQRWRRRLAFDLLPLLCSVSCNACSRVRPRIRAAVSRKFLSRRPCCVNAWSRRRRVPCACALQRVASRCLRTAFGCAIMAAVVLRQENVAVKRRRVFVKTPAHDVRVGSTNAAAHAGGAHGLGEERRRGRPPLGDVCASRSLYKTFFWSYRKWCVQRVASRSWDGSWPPPGVHALRAASHDARVAVLRAWAQHSTSHRSVKAWALAYWTGRLRTLTVLPWTQSPSGGVVLQCS